MYISAWLVNFALKVDIHLYISWTRYDPIVANMSVCCSDGVGMQGGGGLPYRHFDMDAISSLQIQCILLDVGANIATPISTARESHLSMYLMTR